MLNGRQIREDKNTLVWTKDAYKTLKHYDLFCTHVFKD